MFDVTPDEIAQLNDTDVRELVGRLCEAEWRGEGSLPLLSRGAAARQPPMAVWTRGYF